MKHQVTVTVNDDVYDYINAKATKEHRSIASVVRELLVNSITELKK